jgi:TPP-dependent indolepyruvate ferredoxin oxidoreductase alpha subunit
MSNLSPVIIDDDKCVKCFTCVEAFACPAIQTRGAGRAPFIHAELCNGTTAASVCPAAIIRRLLAQLVAQAGRGGG